MRYADPPPAHAFFAPSVLAVGGAMGLGVALIAAKDGAERTALYAVLAAVGAFATAVAWGLRLHHRYGLRRLAAAHLGPGWHAAAVASHTVPGRDHVNLFRAIEGLHAASPDAPPPVGLAFQGLRAAEAGNDHRRPLDFVSLPVAPDETTPCPVSAVFFLWLPDGTPFLAKMTNCAVEVMAVAQADAKAALELILAEVGRRSVYRGAVVSVERPTGTGQDEDPDYVIRFHDMPAVARDRIVLPDEILKVLERNVIGLLTHAETLKKAGRSTRHGVLLHGPPGTGKTLAVRYLASAAVGATVVVLTGRQLQLVRESCRLARLLAPSVVVLEDVDLIATDREQSRDTALLHDLMDEMDGLGPRAAVVFVLTTNRPDVIERALAGRPGRVDQAVYFPLPGPDDRRKLFHVFGRAVDLSAVDLGAWVDRTAGASPAFLAELVRKAVAFAAERPGPADRLPLADADFAAAVRELVEFGGELTRSLLGYRTDPDAGGRLGSAPPAGRSP